jgi:hypothetical protein
MGPIELDVRITEKVLHEALSLTRPRTGVLGGVVEYGMAIYWLFPGAILAWFGLRGVLGYFLGPERDLLRFLFSAVMLAVPTSAVAFVVRSVLKARRAKRSRIGSVKYAITAEEVSGSTPEGASFRELWSSYAGFYVGSRCILCPKRPAGGFLLVPTESLAAEQISEIRQVLARRLPELDSKALRAAVAGESVGRNGRQQNEQ